MKKGPSELLPLYRQVLERYEAEGQTERAAIQRRLIARLEEMAREEAEKKKAKTRRRR